MSSPTIVGNRSLHTPQRDLNHVMARDQAEVESLHQYMYGVNEKDEEHKGGENEDKETKDEKRKRSKGQLTNKKMKNRV